MGGVRSLEQRIVRAEIVAFPPLRQATDDIVTCGTEAFATSSDVWLAGFGAAIVGAQVKQTDMPATAEAQMLRSTVTNRCRRSALCVVLLAVIGPKLGAQTAAIPTFWQGARLRVTSPALGPQRQVVTLLRQHADTIVVRVQGKHDSTALRSVDISRLELSRGNHRRVKKGLIIGGTSGAALGAVISYATYKKSDCTDQYVCDPFKASSRSDAALGGAIGGGLLGGLVGAAVGAVWRVEEWEYLQIAGRRTSLRVVSGVGGVAVSAAF
jgi:hypothetical protein